MISRAEVDKLLEVRAPGPWLLSLYVQLPLDPAELRGLPAHVGELFALAARDGPGVPAAVRVGAAEARAVRGLLASHARDWLGHTVAIFACAELGLAEAMPLPCQLQERAVLATRPHVRPVLLAIQRCPAYRVAVVDRRHTWLFSIAGGQISTAALPLAEGMRSHGFSGWYGLEAHRVNERIIQLARHHYRDTAALLEQASRASEAEPLVIGGHQDIIPQLLAVLPPGLRDQFAGSFVADPHTLTPAKVRDLAGPRHPRLADRARPANRSRVPGRAAGRADGDRPERLPGRGKPARYPAAAGPRRRPCSRIRLPAVRRAQQHWRRLPARARGIAGRP